MCVESCFHSRGIHLYSESQQIPMNISLYWTPLYFSSKLKMQTRSSKMWLWFTCSVCQVGRAMGWRPQAHGRLKNLKGIPLISKLLWSTSNDCECQNWMLLVGGRDKFIIYWTWFFTSCTELQASDSYSAPYVISSQTFKSSHSSQEIFIL